MCFHQALLHIERERPSQEAFLKLLQAYPEALKTLKVMITLGPDPNAGGLHLVLKANARVLDWVPNLMLWYYMASQAAPGLPRGPQNTQGD
jgi:hypothetical protein